ncbi:kinase-like protein [Calocera viscosa TUFC12733]|uniref:Kinase-like protein n=1 Tax=Calocera viscosa (strain TUFC12733) TaxID=1330018 RepID=A0A167MLN4_CALVF|nr:kinase-like protein [Calocera viscosa TUFC12733]
MSLAQDNDQHLPLPAHDAQAESALDTSDSQPVFDWWLRPKPAAARGRTGLTASASLGNAGFASFRDVVQDAEETGRGELVPPESGIGRRIVTSPLDISTTTPARRHRPSTAGSAGPSGVTSPANSSPASQFLAVFSPPKSAYDDDGQVVGEYTLGRVVGTGAFGEVRRAVNNSTGAVVAVKAIRKGQSAAGPGGEASTELADRESAIWFGLSHDNVLPLFATFDTPYTVYLVMLYCPAGSLLQRVNDKARPGAGGGLPQAEAGRLFAQIVEGLKYLHLTAKIVHGDLKLENVLIDPEGRCHIADFGLARAIGAPALDPPTHPTPEERTNGVGLVRARTWQARHSSPIPSKRPALAGGRQSFHPGSLEYAAPELLRPSPSFNSTSTPSSDELANPAQDIWALGCILYALLTGRLPFVDSFQPRLQMKIVRGSWEMPASIGRRAEELLRGCLCMDVRERWDITRVAESEWVQRWRERSRSRGRNRSREPAHEAQSLSRPRTRSLDLRSPDEPFSSSPASLRSPRSPSHDRHRTRPHFPHSHSQSVEDDLPPLSPAGAVNGQREGGDRSPSAGTPGPGTPRDGQAAPFSHIVGSRSRSRGRRLAGQGISGLGILEEHQVMNVDEEGEAGCVPRGRRMGRAVGSPGRTRAEPDVGPYDGLQEGSAVGDGAVVANGRSGKPRSSRSASRDRAARERERQAERRSKSLGYALRERSGTREGG